ncbi:hypothetical protein VE03_10321 [Pseudogymnoascus sp. 23342-1-I1]|nr:hypothetical protein VE03_10321 [Pseudogymnoascus sp. 23342-1-I1]
MGNQCMIGLFPQAYLNAPNGTIPAASYTIPAVIAPQFLYTICSPQPVAAALQNGGYAPYGPSRAYATQANYSGYMPAHSMMPYSQARQGHMAECQGAMHKDDLALRTPFHGSLGHGYRVPVDRSPIYSTLSPQTPHNAVPAVFTPENARTLDQSLSNPIYGNRNVYIRGLRPDTNDEILAAYARLFGSVETLIAIIDTGTRACKGFGFVEYFDVRDSEKCIRGFYAQGYEVSFAKESFNSRLKAKGDHSSTNLYVSNLPKSMNEMELAAIFINYNVVSSRILHDSQGNSCGAGFAR